MQRKSTKLGSSPHQVHLCEGVAGRGEKLFAFSYQTLAELLDVSVNTIRLRVKRKQLNPESLKDICLAYARKLMGCDCLEFMEQNPEDYSAGCNICVGGEVYISGGPGTQVKLD